MRIKLVLLLKNSAMTIL